MFNKFNTNRFLFEAAGGGTGAGASSGGGEIILDGHLPDDNSGGAAGGAAGGAGGGAAGADDGNGSGAAGGGAAAGGGNDDNVLIDINDETEKFTRLFLSESYDNLDGVKINKDGDIVNVEGDVLVAKADLEKSVGELKTTHVDKATAYIKTLGKVEISGVEHEIQEDGSIKDAEGKVLLTKEQLLEQIMSSDDYLEEGEEYTNVFEEAEGISGLAVYDEKGNKVEFEETAEGVAQRDIMLVNQEGARVAQESINKFFNENPDILEAFYYKKANGNLDGFGLRTNHEGVTVDKDNEDQQFNLVVEGEMLRGKSKEEATKYANLLKDNDLLYDEAGKSLSFMQTKEKEQKAADKTEFDKQQQEAAAANEKHWNEVKTLIDRGRLLDYNIPENIRLVDANNIVSYKTRDEFFEYLSTPVKGGRTQAQLDAMNEPLELKLFYDLLRYTGNNITYIVNQRAKQTAVADARRRFNSGSRISTKKVVVNVPKPTKSGNDNIVM